MNWKRELPIVLVWGMILAGAMMFASGCRLLSHNLKYGHFQESSK